MHYFLYPTKDTTITNDPLYMYKNMGLDEILEVEKRVSYASCASSQTYSQFVGYTSSSIELLLGPKSGSYNSASIDPSIVSSSFAIYNGVVNGAILSRALLQFDLTNISKSIANNEIVGAPKFFLNLKICESVEVPVSYTLAAYPLSQSWEMGTGYKNDGQGSSDGVNWKLRDGVYKLWESGSSLMDCSGGGVWWVSGSVVGSGSGYSEAPYISSNNLYPDCDADSTYIPPATSSYIGPISGGYCCSQSFEYQTSDVRMDVTTIVNAWLTGKLENHGLILLHSDESSSIDYGVLKFFSKETNTIYSPYLDVAWNDATLIWTDPSFDTSSASPIQIRDAVIGMKNMAKEYKFGSIVRMDVTPRKRYPIKTFTNKLSDYLSPYYLPSASYYQIKDAESEETVIPYDDYTRLSFDNVGNYFMLDTTGLPSERYFKVEIRSEQSGSISTFTVPTTFKISR